jgi:MFS family permease
MIEAYRHIFRVRSFRLFWFGFTFSVLGDALTHVAFTWFVYDLTHSAEALGLLMLCYTGPIIVGGLVAGWLLDRFDRRTVMIADNLVRGTAVALIPLLYTFGQLQLWHIYVVAAVYGLFMMIGLAGNPAFVPDLVDASQLDTANALETLSYTLGGVIGPVIAGLLISSIGAPYVILIDAASYFVFALLLSRIPTPGRPVPTATSPERKYSIGHAVRLLLHNPILLSTTIMFLFANIGGGGLISVWLPILSDKVLGGGAELYGFLLGVSSVGEVIGAVLAGSPILRLAVGARICVAQALAGLTLLLLLLPNTAVAAFALVLFGAFSAPLTIWAQTLRMQIIPEDLRGRTFALLRMLMQSGNPIGGALAGLLLPIVGIPAMIALSALLLGTPGALGFSVKALRTAGAVERRELVTAESG